MQAGSVLVVDDEPYVRRSLASVLEAEGWSVRDCAGVREASRSLSEEDVDVVLCDLRLGDGEAFDLLDDLRGRAASVPVIVFSGAGTLADAVRAMKSGAFDYIQKPVDPDELLMLAARAVEHSRLEREVGSLRAALERVQGPRTLIGDSAPLRELRERIERAAGARCPVLIRGESGSGKDVAAEELHRRSPQVALPLWRLHAAALDERSLGEALAPWLGGGAGRADGGMVILEGLTLLPPEAQALLMRLLDAFDLDKRPRRAAARTDLRFVASSADDLEAAVQAGRLRADLFWRLNVFTVTVPPLREHREDIAALAGHFLDWLGAPAGNEGERAERRALSQDALELLGAYGWPGNVRELRNVLERALIVAGPRELDARLLGEILEPAFATSERAPAATLHLRSRLDEVEKGLVESALAQSGDSRKKAAFLLGIDPRNLSYYLRKHGLKD
jgi:DNA-binding NtrC family response regulator